MTYEQLKQTLSADQARYGAINPLSYRIKPIPTMIRRLRWCQYLSTKSWAKPAFLIMKVLFRSSCMKCGCDISYTGEIGEGLKIEHSWGIVINSKCKIGKNVTLLSSCVLGANPRGVPTVGDNVTIGTHALVIGDVHIGDSAWIGAGAIVTHDVPENGVVYGEASATRRIREV